MSLESTTIAMGDSQELEVTTSSLTLEEVETGLKKPRTPFGSRWVADGLVLQCSSAHLLSFF